jgi:Mg2+ and Co2+ transporter CorA
MASTPGKAGELSRDHHFTGLHNLARHTIYLRENCDSALATLEGLCNHHKNIIGNNPAPSQVFTRQALEYRRTLLQSTQRRLASLDNRMSNIIQLSFHLVTQGDSRMMQTENQSMKTIAVMTLIFMPLGTVAAIFGTQFMQIQEEAPYHITVSRDFWLMWLIAIPLTVVVIVVWKVWYREAKGRLIDEIPHRAKDEHGYMGWKELRQGMLKKRHDVRPERESA